MQKKLFSKGSEQPYRPWHLSILIPLLICELLALSLLYQHSFDFTCRDTAPAFMCASLGRIVPRTIAVISVLAIFGFAYRKDIATVFTQHNPLWRKAFFLNLIGFGLGLIPWFIISDTSGSLAVTTAFLLWAGAGFLMGVGTVFMLAPLPIWARLWRRTGWAFPVALFIAFLFPEISDQLQAIWKIEWITDITFQASVAFMEAFGYEVETNAPHKIIGTMGFFVAVGPQCSGVEGFALITAFFLLYAVLFRKDLRFPHVLFLLPLGWLLSWIFNVIRIGTLIMIGAETSPELAINGFHSHAGWVSFTLLSLGFIAISRSIPFFFKAPRAVREKTTQPPLPPLRQDPAAAALLPFAVFMLSALLASTFSETPGIFYPLRVVVVAASLYLFLPVLKKLPWRVDPLSLCIGIGIGILWLITSPPAAEDALPAFGTLTGFLFIIWCIARLIGTGLLVPIIEELLFRDYIVNRIAPAQTGLRYALAILISASLFGALHDRWLAGFLSGLAFSFIVWRTRNITDAILAHAAANIIIGFWALMTGNWFLI